MPAAHLLVAIALLVLPLAGCGPAGPPPKPEGVKVSGKILLHDGTPLSGGTLMLQPESGLYGATAEIQSDGSFTLQDNFGSASVVPGSYHVFLRFPRHPNLAKAVNQRYQENSGEGDSDVTVEFNSDTSDLVIRLKR